MQLFQLLLFQLFQVLPGQCCLHLVGVEKRQLVVSHIPSLRNVAYSLSLFKLPTTEGG